MTPARILIRKPGSAWHSPASTSYDNEDALQTLLEEAPELLPWADPTGVVIARELLVPLTGPVDLVAVSTTGQITVVECKLSANPEIRRHVIGQLLAYASGVAEMSYDLFDAAFAMRTGKPLAAIAGDIASAAGTGWDEETFRAAVASNLATGSMGLFIAVDEITDELKRIVEFLNAHTVADLPVLALELNLVRDEGIEVLLPALYGAEAVRAKPSARSRTDETALFSAIEEYAGSQAREAFRRIFDHAAARRSGFNWGGGQTPSATAWYVVDGQKVAVWSCYVYSQQRRVTFDINFEYLARRGVSEEKLEALITSLEKIPGVKSRYGEVRSAGFRKRPSLEIREYLTKAGAVDTVIEALDQLLA